MDLTEVIVQDLTVQELEKRMEMSKINRCFILICTGVNTNNDCHPNTCGTNNQYGGNCSDFCGAKCNGYCYTDCFTNCRRI